MLALLITAILSHQTYAQSTEVTAVEMPSESANYETIVRGTSFQSTSKIIIDEETIKQSKAPNVSTLLSTQANLTIATGNLQPNTIYLRGGDSSHLLILVDGLPFFDASSSQRTMNVDLLNVKSIRRIEVLKGPQSVLYGGQALTGVIKIETFPLELKDRVQAVAETGRFEYTKGSLAGLKTNEAADIGVLARANWAQKMSPSPLKSSSQIYPSYVSGEDLAFISRGDLTTFLRLSQISEKTDIANFNQGTYQPVDTSDYQLRSRNTSLTAGISAPSSSTRPRLVFGHMNGLKSYEHPTLANQHYGSDLTSVRAESDIVSNEEKNLLLGASYQKERFLFRDNFIEQTDAFNEQRGLFAKWSHDFGSLLGYEAGARTDFINHQDRADSLQFGLLLAERIKLEYATGFKTASLFQLYGMYGNSDLKAEKSRTWSLSFEDKDDDGSFSTTLFDTSFDDLIVAQAVGPAVKYFNVGRAQTRGIEISSTTAFQDQLHGNINFGYQEPRDVTNAKWLARRPLVTASAGLQKNWEKDSAGLQVAYTGDRTDRASATRDRQLASRTLLNVNYNHKINSDLAVYARGNNITDQRFEQSSGFYDEGFFGLVGLELQR